MLYFSGQNIDFKRKLPISICLPWAVKWCDKLSPGYDMHHSKYVSQSVSSVVVAFSVVQWLHARVPPRTSHAHARLWSTGKRLALLGFQAPSILSGTMRKKKDFKIFTFLHAWILCISGFIQDWGISSATALEIPQSCAKPLIYIFIVLGKWGLPCPFPYLYQLKFFYRSP